MNHFMIEFEEQLAPHIYAGSYTELLTGSMIVNSP